MLKLSFVIPCYKSENTLQCVVDDILEFMSTSNNYDYEIILVNDASPDNVGSVIQVLCEKNKKIMGIELSRNFGQHNAMMAGFAYTTGDIVVDIDDDGQLPVGELDKFLEKIDDGYDIVVGKYSEQKSGFFRQIGTFVNNKMARILIDQPNDFSFTSFVVMRRYIVDEILRYKNPYPYLAGLMLRSSGKIINVPIERNARIAGKSNYSFRKLMALWSNGFTAFSVKPLRIATFLGIFSALFGFVLGIIIVLRKLFDPSILAGYSSLMAVILFIGGALMLILGIIGEYVGRIYISLNNSPQYVVRSTINL